ncbi:MAG: inner membrane protein YpjD [Steroidobacteraceae bacterium]
MLPIVVLIIYLCGCLWLFAAAWHREGARVAHGKLLTGLTMTSLGALLHAYLLCRAIFHRPELALNTTDAASLVGWLVAIITLWTIWRSPRFAGIGGALLLCVGIAAAITDDGSRDFVTSQSGWALTTHIIVAIVAYALIAVGAVFAVALWALDQRLHTHQPLGVMSSLPSVEALEAAMFQTISAGFALLTLTLFSGFIFVQDLITQHLVHKAALSCLAWLILGTLLLGHWRLGWRGRTAARWTLGGFLLLGLAYFGSKFILEILLGRHWG